uniref:Putative E3 ubiquitin protein ligase DRIP2 n=1 Tax=Davidia involucrata TaxID=16924 RepID=A0A5B6ZF12_DAVIN
MSNQVVKVRRETIAACMTCPLCNKLLRDATTISECLHTFCRKCIYEKLSDQELECCPICNIDLGCVPLEKLRPDHNLQDVRAKIFPFKRRKVRAPEVAPSVTLPVRRKERSLSSLVVSTPRVSTQTAMTGRRSKAVARKASSLRNSSFSVEKPVNKEEDSVEDRLESSSSPETLNKFTQTVRQNSSTVEPSSHPVPDKETENDAEPWEGKVDLWKPLNCLVEVANRSKSSKCNSQGSAAKSEPQHAPDSEGHVRKTKVKEHGRKSKAQDERNSTDPISPESVKPKKLRRIRQKRKAAPAEFGISPQAVLDAANAKRERRIGPIWFLLVASEDQEGDAPLPQISASYLRIKDGNAPVSFIQKYLMRKLDLTSEDEVEIRCMGQSVLPTLQLNNLVDLWLQTASTSQWVPATIGSSAKDFVMVLAYARKR